MICCKRKSTKEERKYNRAMNKFIKDRKFKHLTFTDRLVISRMVDANMKVKDIAIAIGCSERTIYYELKRSTYEYLDSDTYKIFTKYNPDGAQARYEKNKRNKGFIAASSTALTSCLKVCI